MFTFVVLNIWDYHFVEIVNTSGNCLQKTSLSSGKQTTDSFTIYLHSKWYIDPTLKDNYYGSLYRINHF